MESTGVYWKSVFEALEAEGVKTYVQGLRYIKLNLGPFGQIPIN